MHSMQVRLNCIDENDKSNIDGKTWFEYTLCIILRDSFRCTLYISSAGLPDISILDFISSKRGRFLVPIEALLSSN